MVDTLPSDISHIACSVSVQVKMQVAVGLLVISLCMGTQVNFSLTLDDINHSEKGLNNENVTAVNETTAESTVQDGNFRLNPTVIPYHYVIRMIHNLTSKDMGNLTAPGKVWISISVTEATDNITLHADDLVIEKVEVITAQTGSNVSINGTTLDKEKQFLLIHMKERLKPGRYMVYVEYIARIAEDRLNGLYLDYYVEPTSGERKYLATTLFAPNHARKAFVCADEPALRATFDIAVAHPKNFTTLSNMQQKEKPTAEVLSWKIPNTYEWTQFETTPMMSTYLVATITFDFESSKSTFVTDVNGNQIELKAWAPSHLQNYLESSKSTDFALDVMSNVLPNLNGFFNVSYPIPKLDVVSLPHFYFSAMEQWGLITFKDPVLLTAENVTTQKERARVAEVMGHELSHQIFGNMISLAWWDCVWLKEGFSNFYSDWFVDLAQPDLKPLSHYVTESLLEALRFDEGLESHPLHNPPSGPSSVGDIYTRIPYEKGASLLRMAEAFLSPSVFRQGISLYVQQNQFQSANESQLFQALQKAVNKSGDNSASVIQGAKFPTVEDILNGWISQKGFPLIRASLEPTGVLRLSQEPFINPFVEAISQENEKNGTVVTNSSTLSNRNSSWWIPITLSPKLGDISASEGTDVWLPEGQDEIFVDVTKNATILVNPDAKGYYRVLYDSQLYNRIITQINTNHTVLKDLFRAKLIDDYFTLAFANLTYFDEAMNLTLYLKSETSLEVWTVVLTAFRNIHQKIRIEEDLLNKFEKYMLHYLIPVTQAAEKRLKDLQDITEKVRWHSTLLESTCRYDPEFCDSKLDRDNINSIPADQQAPLLCAFMANAQNESDASERSSKVQELYAAEAFPVMRSRYLKALSCVKHKSLLEKFLNSTLDVNKHDVERGEIFDTVASNKAGKPLILPFLRENFQSLFKNASVANPVIRGIKAVVPYSSSADDVQSIGSFIADFSEKLGPVNVKSLEKQVRKVKLNSLLVEYIAPKLRSWLTRWKESFNGN